MADIVDLQHTGRFAADGTGIRAGSVRIALGGFGGKVDRCGGRIHIGLVMPFVGEVLVSNRTIGVGRAGIIPVRCSQT
ncbi:hypothetical protein AGR6A_Lc140089 [Agrobacterium sp. NCPPB 925]|nr:hypothetical protein AGR6A_Lc140089 [Agrobacterium sp. NCPPB 925]